MSDGQWAMHDGRWAMGDAKRPREAIASRGRSLKAHRARLIAQSASRSSTHENDVPVLVEPELLVEPAHTARLRGYPHGLQVGLQRGRGRLHDEPLESVLTAAL